MSVVVEYLRLALRDAGILPTEAEALRRRAAKRALKRNSAAATGSDEPRRPKVGRAFAWRGHGPPERRSEVD